jgi:hypothetical protein
MVLRRVNTALVNKVDDTGLKLVNQPIEVQFSLVVSLDRQVKPQACSRGASFGAKRHMFFMRGQRFVKLTIFKPHNRSTVLSFYY